MSVLLTAAQMQTTKQANAYQVKNPTKVVTEFTPKTDTQAAQALKLSSQSQIKQVKEILQGYDMTNISTDELKKIGRVLFDNNLISNKVFSSFIDGDMAYDAEGKQTDTHVKFNAIAMFDEMLEDNRAHGREVAKYGYQESVEYAKQVILETNQAVNALAFFIKSDSDSLALHIEA